MDVFFHRYLDNVFYFRNLTFAGKAVLAVMACKDKYFLELGPNFLTKFALMKQKIELLAPARDAETAIAAIAHGADAVYIGASSHGARVAAANSVADIARVVDYSHKFGAKVYVTVNTLVYDNELADVVGLVNELYRIGVDALIVQDVGLLMLDLPPIDLHASTQCDIRDVDRARMLADAGFSRLVLPREMSLGDIADVHRELPSTELEVFVHGALCVCYSGDCRASFVMTGRSANRGECSQVCRLPFDLVDGHGNVVVKGRHLLSLRDMNRSAYVAEMMDAGVTSFKIEGRLKDAGYVKNTVAAYRRVIDEAIAARPEMFERSSLGCSQVGFVPDLGKSFNRGFTDYFIDGGARHGKMACHATPKSIGHRVVVTSGVSRGRTVPVKSEVALANGDGLGWFNGKGDFEGFRVNRVEPGCVIAARPVKIPAGTVLFRNRDKVWDDMLDGDTARRSIDVTMILRQPSSRCVALDVTVTENGLSVTSAAEVVINQARTSQCGQRRRVLSKTGDTVFRVVDIDDRLGDVFVPVSWLADLRRRALAILQSAIGIAFTRKLRRSPAGSLKLDTHRPLPLSVNVANKAAYEFYRSRGAVDIPKAVEIDKSVSSSPGLRVMTARYCLRHELGLCLKTPHGRSMQGPLFLKPVVSRGLRALRLDFDCEACLMHVYTT